MPMPDGLSILKTFGFFVAMAFIAAAIALTKELKRKEKQGLFIPVYKTMEIGKPASRNELIISAIIGFIIGMKVGGFWGHMAEISPNPMGYLFSLKGNILIGVLLAIVLAYMKYAEKKKQQLAEPIVKQVPIYPHERIADIVVIAAVGGLAGAKIFNAFETWDQFLKDPIGSLLSSDGLTFYGGLIVATTALYIAARKWRMPFRELCDAAAPSLMLAYGIGRLGCHFAGDGDWGIFNSAYITQPDGSLGHAVNKGDFAHALYKNAVDYRSVSADFFKAPSWLPDWTVAMNFPHNVAREGVMIPGCTGQYCTILPVGVFPTSMYEAIACILLFFFLWAIRKRMKYPLHLFGVYLILNGLERFFVEKIRVNYKYDWGFLHPTQAEIISTILVLSGIGILLFYKKKREVLVTPPKPVS